LDIGQKRGIKGIEKIYNLSLASPGPALEGRTHPLNLNLLLKHVIETSKIEYPCPVAKRIGVHSPIAYQF